MFRNNASVEYASDYNIHSEPSLLENYQVVVIAGHGEYWSLDVFSITGEHISTVLDEYKTPGFHHLEFNAGILSSGIYIYKIDAVSENFTFTDYKKLVLIK